MQFEAFFGVRKSERSFIRPSEGSGTTTMDVSYNAWQVFNLSAGRTVVLPTTDVKQGDRVMLENTTNFDLTVQASNTSPLTVANSANIDATIRAGYVLLEALQDTPTTPAHWRVVHVYEKGSYTLSFVNGVTASGTFNFTRHNKTLVAQLPIIVGATNVNAISTAIGALAVRHAPATETYCAASGRVNSSNTAIPAKVLVRATGKVDYAAAWDTATTFGASGAGNGMDDTVSASWVTT